LCAASILSVEGIGKRFFPSFWAVRKVDLEIFPGETLGLLGASGSGKSTLGRLMLRLLRPDEGTVRFEGRDIGHLPESKLRPLRPLIQKLFQHPETTFNPRRTVGDSIRETLRYHRKVSNNSQMDDMVLDCIRDVGLHLEHMDRRPGELSGGQLQRAALARILSLDPRVIVADEPTSMLDVSVQAQILNLMMNLQAARGISFLFISHDVAVIKAVSHRVAVMHRGAVVEVGPARDVLNNPRHSITGQLIEAYYFARSSRRYSVSQEAYADR